MSGSRHDLAGGVVDEPDRQRRLQLAAARLGQDAALQAGADEVQLGLAHRAFEAEQQPVVEVAGVVEAVLVADQRPGERADLEQPVPVGVVAGQARDLEAEHDPGLAQADLGDQALEALAAGRRGARTGPGRSRSRRSARPASPARPRAGAARTGARRTRCCAAPGAARTGARTGTRSAPGAPRSPSSAIAAVAVAAVLIRPPAARAPSTPARRRARRRPPRDRCRPAGTRARGAGWPGHARVQAATPRRCSSASPSCQPAPSPGQRAGAQPLVALDVTAAVVVAVDAVIGRLSLLGGAARQRALDRARMHPHARTARRSRRPARRGRSDGSASSRSRANATTSSVSLCAPRGPGRAGTSARQPARVQRRLGLIERRPREPELARRAASPCPRRRRTRRTISYLTCTRSRASRNSDPAKRSSRTRSGRGFRHRCARNAASFGSSPSPPPTPPRIDCQHNSAAPVGRNASTRLAHGHTACLTCKLNGNTRRHLRCRGRRPQGTPAESALQMRRNMSLQRCRHRQRARARRSAPPARPDRQPATGCGRPPRPRTGPARPRPSTPLGSDRCVPSSSRKNTRCSPHVLRTATNTYSRPAHG